MSIHIQRLTKQYDGTRRAVDDISFAVELGQIVGFLGPNGAGKSTTMKIATGYLAPSSGTAHIAGHDVLADPMAVRRSVGYLPEHNPLYTDLYVREYLRFAGRLHGLSGQALDARIRAVIGQVGLNQEQHKRIGQLSKGYRQRVGLAQAFLHNPPVLILDEPTTGLDPNQLADIRDVIRSVGQNKTVLFSTHIMQEVEALCDRVIIINKGRLVADSPLSTLRTQLADEATYIAEFEADLPHAALLGTLPGVSGVERTGPGQYRLTAPAQADLRAAIFRLAADKDLTLIGLRQQETSLEGVFKQLTSG
jgi:ABC-2 type transport system ATP-binding protein